jgi:hypothetical protein
MPPGKEWIFNLILQNEANFHVLFAKKYAIFTYKGRTAFKISYVLKTEKYRNTMIYLMAGN